MPLKTLYETIEVAENVSPEILSVVYKKLAFASHPDRSKSEARRKENEERLKRINEAFDVLSDKEKRRAYDLELKEQRRQDDIALRRAIEFRVQESFEHDRSRMAEVMAMLRGMNDGFRPRPSRALADPNFDEQTSVFRGPGGMPTTVRTRTPKR